MTESLHLPAAGPVDGIVYTPGEALAFLRTLTLDGLLTKVKRRQVPFTKLGRKVGFTGAQILWIIAHAETPAEEIPQPRRDAARRQYAHVAAVPAGQAPIRLVAKEPRVRRRRPA